MGSQPPPPTSSSASLLLPSLHPPEDSWFISSTSDLLLTQALSRELHSTSASCSSSSGAASVEASLASKHSSDIFHFQMQSNASQVGSPLSSDSVSKDQPESPFNYTNGTGSVYGRMSTITMSNRNSIAEGDLSQQFPVSHTGQRKAATLVQAPSVALSSQASAGAGTKVSKRRPRASKKTPITVLSADTSNFRAMVQQLTGLPTPPSIWGSPSGVPLLKPQPTRISPLDLPTLDTSSSFLAPKINPFLQAGHEALAGLIAPQKGKPSFRSSYYPNIMSYDALLSSSPSAAAAPGSPWDLLASAKIDGSFTRGDLKQPSTGDMGLARPSPTSIESFLMVDEDQYLRAPFSTVDSWLAFDGGAMSNPSPRLDLAKIAS